MGLFLLSIFHCIAALEDLWQSLKQGMSQFRQRRAVSYERERLGVELANLQDEIKNIHIANLKQYPSHLWAFIKLSMRI